MTFGFATKPRWCGLLMAVVLIFAQLVLAQGAADPCATRVSYDQAKAAADAADRAFGKFQEPDWSKLPKGYEIYINPGVQDLLSLNLPDRNQRVGAVLKKLKDDFQANRAIVGNLTLKQLETNLDTAKARQKTVKQQYDQ